MASSEDDEAANQNIKFGFDFTVKKFSHEYYTFGAVIYEIGTTAVVFSMLIYLVTCIVGVYTMRQFLSNFADLVERKYQLASDLVLVKNMLRKFSQIHMALGSLSQFKSIITEIEEFTSMDLEQCSHSDLMSNYQRMQILNQKLPNIEDIQDAFKKFEVSEAEQARINEREAVIEKRCEWSYADIVSQIKDRVSYYGIFNIHDEIEMNAAYIRGEIKIQNGKVEFLYQALAQD